MPTKPDFKTTLAAVPPWDAGEPRLNCPGVFGARKGSPFFFSIPAIGKRPLTFSAEGLPPGLELDPRTGIITGMADDEGEREVTLTATNGHGTNGCELKIIIGETFCLTPPLGWNSWNCWASLIDDRKVRDTALHLVRSGLAAHGYSYVNIDDGWQGQRGGPFNTIQGNEKFPDMKALCDCVHTLGLRIGIYSTPWVTSYAGFVGGSVDPEVDPARPGLDDRKIRALGWHHGFRSFEKEDALQWATWGFDYLKYDWNPVDVEHTTRIHDALAECGRDIVLSISNSAPYREAYHWAQLANCWRTTGDIRDNWENMSRIGFSQDIWTPYSRPGHFNDPDMLVVGKLGWGEIRDNLLTLDEQITHVSLWALLAAPLLIGCDLTRLDDSTLRLLCNDEVLAVDQDILAKQGRCLREVRRTHENGDTAYHTSVYVRDLADGSKAVGLFNRGPEPEEIEVTWEELGIKDLHQVRDLWANHDLEAQTRAVKLGVPSHGAQLLKISR